MKRQPTSEEFTLLIQNNRAVISKICCLYMNTQADREDLHQEIMLQLWRSFSSFEGKAAVSTWVYKVALNTAITFLKKNKKQPEVFEACKVFYDEQENDAELNEKLTRFTLMQKAISQLSRIDKALITLYLEDKSYDDISEIMGITSGNARVKIMRLKEKLKQMVIE